MKKKRVIIALAALMLTCATGGLYGWLTRAEPIPAQLEAVTSPPTALEIPGRPGQPPLRLAELAGTTAFFVVVGTWSAKSPEGERLNRALSRWEFPADTRGFIIADAAGLGLLATQINAHMKSYAREVKVPLYLDYDGAFLDAFALPKGHHGFVALSPSGEILARHSGDIDAAELERIRRLLGASEPKAGPPMPPLSSGPLTTQLCAETACAFISLGHATVRRSDIPRLRPGGFEGNDDDRLRQMRVPHVRAVTKARRMKLTRARGVVLGDLDASIDLPGWDRVTGDAAKPIRRALGLIHDDVEVVVYDHGFEALRVRGLMPLFQLGRMADLLHVEGFNDRRPPRE